MGPEQLVLLPDEQLALKSAQQLVLLPDEQLVLKSAEQLVLLPDEQLALKQIIMSANQFGALPYPQSVMMQ